VTRSQTLTCLVALAVLAAVALWQRRPVEAGDAGPQVLVDEGTLKVLGGIEIRREGREGESGQLEQRDGAWFLTSRDDAPVNADHVRRLVEAIDGLVAEERAHEVSLLEEFQLAGDGVTHLVFTDGAGAELLHLLVGKKGPRTNRSFVRPDGDDRAWLAHAGLHSALGIHGHGDRPLDPDYFLDLHLFGVDAEAVTRMSADGAGAWSAVRATAEEAWTWEPSRAEAPDERQVTGKTHTFSRTRAATLVGRQSLEGFGLDAPVSRATVIADGVTRTLVVGDAVEDDPDDDRKRDERYVTVEGTGLIWTLSASAIDSLMREP
jgi:hypothetical protein